MIILYFAALVDIAFISRSWTYRLFVSVVVGVARRVLIALLGDCSIIPLATSSHDPHGIAHTCTGRAYGKLMNTP